MTEMEFGNSLEKGVNDYISNARKDFCLGLLVSFLLATTLTLVLMFSTKIDSILHLTGTVLIPIVFAVIFFGFSSATTIAGLIGQSQFRKKSTQAQRDQILNSKTRSAGWICRTCNSYFKVASNGCPKCHNVLVSSLWYRWIDETEKNQ